MSSNEGSQALQTLEKPPLDAPVSHSSLDDVHEAESIVTESGDHSNDKTAVPGDDTEYPHGLKLALIILSIYLAIFLIALDRTIIATAIPSITDDFQSFGDIGWYASVFLLTSSAPMLLFGKIYSFYSPKWVYLSLILLFEIGSAICGAAPNSPAFIWGRAISGLGSSGIMAGGIVLLVGSLPLHKRPLYQGMIGGVFGVASVAGPLVGGVFTTKVTWRWCFYINLPIGAVTLVLLFFILEAPAARRPGLTIKQKINELDPIGQFLFMPAMVCLILALQWGGTTYAWSDARIIVLFVVFGVLIIAFAAVQYWKQEQATLPPRLLRNRTVYVGCYYQLVVGAAFMAMVYYVPIWFQAIKGFSAIKSGIALLPMLISLVIAGISAGIFTTKVGYYVPPMLSASILLSIGAGLISTWRVDTGHSMWIGYQVVYGLGMGLGMQQPTVAIQTALDKKDVPVGAAFAMFCQATGGTLGVPIAQALINSKLVSGIGGFSDIDPKQIVGTGATELRNLLPPSALPQVLQVYNAALVDVFYFALVLCCISIFGSLSMPWLNVKREQIAKQQAMEKQQAAGALGNPAAVFPVQGGPTDVKVERSSNPDLEQ